ncbi:MAG: hypothetical protein KKC20_25260, partial [Proteobacteria bacterium]|nr:hypothetical protein [Pseudomonadota bacterium]
TIKITTPVNWGSFGLVDGFCRSQNPSSRKKKGEIGNANFYPTSNIQLPTSKLGATTRSSFPSSRAFSEAIQLPIFASV